MAEAAVERRPSTRFFCHRCNLEFEDVSQDYVCPFCASGFIEQLESETDGSLVDDTSDVDMSNLDDSEESLGHPVLNDLAFLMSGGRLRPGRPESLLEQLVWTIGGGASGAMTAGAPFVLVGTPGDYVFGGEGLDAVVTQLLGQLENSGPPPLPREQIDSIPKLEITKQQVEANASCSVCLESFQEGTKVSKLQCEHMFHTTCIEPWLQLHATCPVCRHSFLPEANRRSSEPAPPTPSEPTRVVVHRVPRVLSSGATSQWDSPPTSSSSHSSLLWPNTTNSSSSLNASDDNSHNMDIDFE